MVNNSDEPLDRIFGALSDPTRRAIVRRLAGGDVPVTTLAAPFAMSLPAISKHLRVLEGAGLIERRTAGRQRFCRLNRGTLAAASDWIAASQAFWSARLEDLDAFLAEEEEIPHDDDHR